MPTFSVKSPDGKTYRVNAPEGATQAQAIAFVQKRFAAPKKRTVLETVGDFAGDTIDNVLPNWGDEIKGAGYWTKAKLGVPGYNKETAFADGQKAFKDQQAQYDNEHPNLAWGSTIAGSAAGIALPVSKAGLAAKGVGIGARAVKAGKVGALFGAASGAGQGSGVSERGVNAITGAAVGGATGAAIPFAGAAARKVGRGIRAVTPDAAIRAVQNVPRRVMGLPPVPANARAIAHADRILADDMTKGHIQTGMGQHGQPSSPDAVADEVARRARMEVPAMVGDTTEALRNRTSWASRGTGPGQTAVRNALNARKSSEGQRVRQHVVDTMGPAVDPIAAVADNLAASKAAAAPLYREAYELPTQITPEMARIMETPAFREAVPQAVTNIRNNMGDPRTMGFVPQADGSFISPAEGVLTTEGFDQVQRAMTGAARKAGDTNPLTGAVTHNTDSVHMNARAVDLQRQLRDQNAPLDQAISGYADEAAQRQAMQAGGDVGKLTGHEINAQARALPADAHPGFMQGARTALADQASEYGAKFPNGDTARAVSKSIGDQPKVDAIVGMDSQRMGPSALPALQQRLEAEHQGNIVAKDVLQGSQTANKQALDADMDGGTFSSLTKTGMAMAAVRNIADRAASPYRKAVKERIAQVVTETNPATVRELMAEIAARAERDAEFAALMQKSGVIAAASYGQNIKADEPTE